VERPRVVSGSASPRCASRGRRLLALVNRWLLRRRSGLRGAHHRQPGRRRVALLEQELGQSRSLRHVPPHQPGPHHAGPPRLPAVLVSSVSAGMAERVGRVGIPRRWSQCRLWERHCGAGSPQAPRRRSGARRSVPRVAPGPPSWGGPRCCSASPRPGETLLHPLSLRANRRALSAAVLGICKILTCVEHRLWGHVAGQSCSGAWRWAAEPRAGRSIPGAVQGPSGHRQPGMGRGMR